MPKLRRKYGIVAVLDALGAGSYSAAQIKQFLSARADVNDTVRNFARKLPAGRSFCRPTIFTFGDTIIITAELAPRNIF
jgi:hypothetical protein